MHEQTNVRQTEQAGETVPAEGRAAEAVPARERAGETLPPKVRGIRIRNVNAFIVSFACMLLVLFLLVSSHITKTYDSFQEDIEKYVASELAANDLRHSSDELTTSVRMFAITTEIRYMNLYFEEVYSGERERALDTLKKYLGASRSERYLDSAMRNSLELMGIEYKSMRLVADACGYQTDGEIRATLENVPLSAEEAALPPEEKLFLARDMLHDEIYQGFDARIDRNVSACILHLGAERQASLERHTAQLDRLFFHQRVLAFLLLSVCLCAVVVMNIMIILPLYAHAKRIRNFQPLPMSGAYELRRLSEAYNKMYAENQRSSEFLRHEAEHDALTGLYNRGAFEKLRKAYQDKPIALMLIDVDLFKHVNDTYGHDVGDQVLQKVARLLDHNFRLNDYPCRIGGDEFAVIMVNASSRLKKTVHEKLSLIAERLRDTSDGLPAVTMSIGVAFCDRVDGTDDIYKDADRALYAVKTHGRDGCEFYGERYVKF